MTQQSNAPDQTSGHTPEQVATAIQSLAKLPALGPAIWLYARDPRYKFTFVADIDWRLLPPMLLDQFQLFSRNEVPWAFLTWAFVSDEVNERLKATGVIAPHEWKSGPHAWLIDIVLPFGKDDAFLRRSAADIAPGRTVNAWVADVDGSLRVETLQFGA